MKTVENIKRLTPFSNGNEALQWTAKNCDRCKYSRCHAKKVIELGFITGEITLNRARWIGLENNRLKSECEKFITKTNRSKKVVSYKEDDNFIYKMF